MKRKNILLAGILVLLSSIVLVVYGYAWYAGKKFESLEGKVNPSYFAGGNGSEKQPFLITNKIHMYNLAWLQYLGVFNKDVLDDGHQLKQYHFEISVKEIDMTGLALPPIGTEDNPFIGSFEGNGCVIKNVITSNNISSLKEHPNFDNFNLGSVVGFFGVIGDNGTLPPGVTISNTVNSVNNFFLDNVMVESNTDTTLIGIVAGYVNANIQNIGVTYSKISLAKGMTHLNNMKKISNYSLIGYVDESNIEWTDKPGSGGPGYGTSTDIEQLYKDLGGEDGAAGGEDGAAIIGKAEAYPFRPSDSTIIPASVSKKEMELQSGRKEVSVAQTQASSQSNIGYYVGSDVKVYHKTGVDYSKFYYPDTASDSRELTGDELPDQSIIDYLNVEGDYEIRLSGNSQLNVQNEGGQVVVENGQVGTYQGDLLLPTRCIWVAPIRSGTLKFVFVNIEKDPMGMCIEQLTRSKPGDYSSYFLASKRILSFNNLLLPGKAYYFEVDVTQDDIDAGYEYAITGGDNYKPYFSYLDIGAAGGGIVPEYIGMIKDVDFVYDITLNISENLSEVLFSIDGTSITSVIFYFRRNELNGVLYFIDPTDNGLSFDSIGNGKKQEADIRRNVNN